MTVDAARVLDGLAPRRARFLALARARVGTVVALVSTVSLPARRVRAEAPLAEPVIEENITDVDSMETGTLELDTTHTVVHARHNPNGVWRDAIEAEWRPFARAGIGAELGLGGTMEGASLKDPAIASRGTLSYVFTQDFARMIFLQGETSAQYPTSSSSALLDLTEPALPYTAGLRGALLFHSLTLRAAAFFEGGGASSHAPVRASWAALYGIPLGSFVVHLGSEAVADWAQPRPFLVAPEALVVTPVFGKSVRFGMAFPTSIGATREQSSFGVSLRAVLEPQD